MKLDHIEFNLKYSNMLEAISLCAKLHRDYINYFNKNGKDHWEKYERFYKAERELLDNQYQKVLEFFQNCVLVKGDYAYRLTTIGICDEHLHEVTIEIQDLKTKKYSFEYVPIRQFLDNILYAKKTKFIPGKTGCKLFIER